MFKPKSLNDLNMAMVTSADVEITVDGKKHVGKVVSTGPASSRRKEVTIELLEKGVKREYVVKKMYVGCQ